MKTLFLTFCVGICIFFQGCASNPAASVREKTDEAISQGVYATNDSMELGRFDLAYKYSGQTTRLVAPPKTRIPIKGVYR